VREVRACESARAVRLRRAYLEQHALDPARVRLRDVLAHPVAAEHVPGDLDDDVVGVGARVAAEAR
ncbi:MAG: hypothetical protein ABI585_08665, partial [Betaproteobacteria bacterium]